MRLLIVVGENKAETVKGLKKFSFHRRFLYRKKFFILKIKNFFVNFLGFIIKIDLPINFIFLQKLTCRGFVTISEIMETVRISHYIEMVIQGALNVTIILGYLEYIKCLYYGLLKASSLLCHD